MRKIIMSGLECAYCENKAEILYSEFHGTADGKYDYKNGIEKSLCKQHADYYIETAAIFNNYVTMQTLPSGNSVIHVYTKDKKIFVTLGKLKCTYCGEPAEVYITEEHHLEQTRERSMCHNCATEYRERILHQPNPGLITQTTGNRKIDNE